MSVFEKIVAHFRETAKLQSIQAVLEWDERTYLPAAAGEYRAEQLTYLAGMLHRRQTEPQVGQWLEEAAERTASEDPHADQAATIRVLKREFEKRCKLSSRLVEAMADNSVRGQQAWVAARKEKNFKRLQPFLERTIELKREQAQATGFDECIYDALLDDFEPGEKTSRVREVFASLRDELAPIMQAIVGSGIAPPVGVLHRAYPIEQQEAMARLAAESIGFDFQRGRLDVTDHPFCTELGPHDCRLTTRYDENFFSQSFFGTLHEAGHGLYDQGLRRDFFGLPPGCPTSMGIHESQSRLWENLVGRGRAFWEYFFPAARSLFPAALGDVNVDDFFRAVNVVSPSLIRVEADELTYNLHIIIRFELEQELLDGRLPVAELPSAWNARYEEYLGVKPPDDADGVLQDVHWSASLLGYFPTYALGNLYAAQFFAQATRDLPDLQQQIQRGDFHPLREWLAEKIHRRGQCYSAAELVQEVTGNPLSSASLLTYLQDKMRDVYGI